MDSQASPLIGQSIPLTLDGQSVVGRITGVAPHKLEVVLTVHQPAKDIAGTRAQATLPDGRPVEFSLSGNGYWANLVIDVPLPAPPPAAEPPPKASVPAPSGAPSHAPTAAAPAPQAPSADAVAPAPTPTAPPQGTASKVGAPEGKERRRFFRFGVHVPVEIFLGTLDDPLNLRVAGTTLNLSGGGMLVQTKEPLMPGNFTFRLHLPQETLTLNGRVIASPKGATTLTPVEFLALNDSDQAKIVRFIFRRMRNLSDVEPPAPTANNRPHDRARARRERFSFISSPRYW